MFTRYDIEEGQGRGWESLMIGALEVFHNTIWLSKRIAEKARTQGTCP